MAEGRNRTGRVVSATEIASLFYCEQKLVLDIRKGELVTPEQEAARARGDQLHHQAHQAATQLHNRRPSPDRKGPCFVATLVYGCDDPRTNEFRRFRDRCLRRTHVGRLAIATYYRLSPAVVARLQQHPTAIRMIKVCLDALRFTLTPWTGESRNDVPDQSLRPE